MSSNKREIATIRASSEFKIQPERRAHLPTIAVGVPWIPRIASRMMKINRINDGSDTAFSLSVSHRSKRQTTHPRRFTKQRFGRPEAPVKGAKLATNHHPHRTISAPRTSRALNESVAEFVSFPLQSVQSSRDFPSPFCGLPISRRFTQPAEASKSTKRPASPDRTGPAAPACRARPRAIPPARIATSSSGSATGSTCSARRAPQAR